MNFLAACLLLAAATPGESPDMALAQAIRTTYDANRAQFTHWTIRFKFTVAKARDLEGAISRRWTDEAVGDGFSAFDGRRGRHEILYSLKDLAEKRTWTAPDRFDTHISSDRHLTDGNVTFFDMIDAGKEGKKLFHTAQINPGKESFHSRVFLPLDLGRLPGHEVNRLSSDIHAVSEGRPGYTMKVREGVRLFNRDLIELTITAAEPVISTRQYWVDLEQGAMVRKAQSTLKLPDDSHAETDYVWEDIRQIGDSAWFPFRQVRYSHHTGMSFELLVTEAEFATLPDKSVFRMEFDEARPIRDNARDVRYPAQKIWDLDNLPAPEVSHDQPVPWTSAPAAPMPGERQATPRWWTFAAIGLGVVLLTLAGRSFQRSRRDA
jgi:hypothetical protein